MAGRTIAIGDVHGDLEALEILLSRLPLLDEHDTIVFLGDYLDRGPRSKEVIERVRGLHHHVAAKIVALRGNHEDAWLTVIREGWPGFVLPPGNGTIPCMLSYQPDLQGDEAAEALFTGSFFPDDVIAWMRELPLWYEDINGLYVHAGVPRVDGRWLHPSEVKDPQVLLWQREPEFFEEYDGPLIVCGHTTTNTLPPGLSQYTPEDPRDLYWAGKTAYVIDTGAGKGGFLTALELPSGQVYESRD